MTSCAGRPRPGCGRVRKYVLTHILLRCSIPHVCADLLAGRSATRRRISGPPTSQRPQLLGLVLLVFCRRVLCPSSRARAQLVVRRGEGGRTARGGRNE